MPDSSSNDGQRISRVDVTSGSTAAESRSRAGSPDGKYRVFISYGTGDGFLVRELVAKRLSDAGAEVFIDSLKVEFGDKLPDEIFAELQNSDELGAAILRSIRVIPIVYGLTEGDLHAKGILSLLGPRRFLVLDEWQRTGLVVAILLVTTLLFLMTFLARSTPGTFKVNISVEGGIHRGDSPSVGDNLIISATATDLLLVYRDERLELQCPGDELCTRTGDGWTVNLKLSAVGAYRILYAAGVGPIVLTRSLDQDSVMLDNAATHLGSSPTMSVQ